MPQLPDIKTGEKNSIQQKSCQEEKDAGQG